MLALSARELTMAGIHAIQCPSGYELFPGANGQDQCVIVPHQVTTFFTGFFVLAILVGLFMLLCQIKIISKAGYSGWYVLTGFVPILGLVMFLIFVFGKWPIQERLERAERGGGRYLPPPPGAGYAGMPGPGPGQGSGGGPGPGPGNAPPIGSAPGVAFAPPVSGGPGPAVATALAPASVATAPRGSGDAGVIYCSWCGKERAIDAQAIHYCGSMDRPVVYCMSCGTALDGASSCASCGTPATKISR